MSTAAPHDDWIQQTAALRRLARALVGHGPDAEDLVQDALLAGWQRGDRTPSPGWLRSMIRSRSVDLRRRAGRRRAASLEGLDTVDPKGAEPAAVAEHIEVQQGLLRAVQELAPNYRDVIYLRFFEGLSPREIAARLGAPGGTVRARLSRGLALLQDRLDEQPLRGEQDEAVGFRHGLLLFASGAPLSHATAPAAPVALTSLTTALVPMKIITAAAVFLLVCVASYFALADTQPTLIDGVDVTVAVGSDPVDLNSAADPQPGVASGRSPATARAATDPTDPRDERLSVPVRNEELAVSSSPLTGALDVEVIWHSGAAADGVTVLALASDGPDGNRSAYRNVTDAMGLAAFSGLRAGRYSVRVSRGGSHGATKSADVGPGNKATVSLKLEAGVTVNGVVRETSGAPVAGARIWLTSPTSGWAGGQVVTQTDSAGGFRLRDIPTGASIGAIAEGWTPSGLLDLDLVGVVDGEALVELELSLAGGAAAVSVEGTGGEPVPGALVAITRGTAPYRRRLNLTSAESWTPRTKRTNAAGQLRFDGLGEGVHEIHVRVEGVPRWSGDIEVLSSSDAELTVRLQGTCTVMGRVFGSDGMPAQGAIVRVVPPEPAMLTDGPGGSPFAQPWTKAGNDGRFTLFGLTPGRVKVSATLEDSPASATTTLSLTSGETATWEPVLDEGGRILGSLLYADRSAVNTTYVVATAIGSREETSVHVSRGKFRFEGLTEEAYDLRVESLEPTLVNIEARLEGVRPTRGATDEPIEWILEAEAPAPRRHYVVRAILRDEGVRAPEGGSLRMVLQDDASGVTYLGRADKERSPQGDSSAWLVNMQRPADVTPIFLHGGRVIAWGESVELDGAGDVDLGTIRSVPGATIQLDLVRPSALRDEPVTIELEVAGLSTKETVDFGAASQVQLDRLEPGPAILRLSGPQCVPITRELVLESGKQASLTLELALR